jgi:integrase
MFAAMDDEEKLLYGLFLNSGVRDAEMQKTEYADFNWEKCTQHVQPKAWRKFRLKGKSKNKSAKDRFIPIPAKLVWKIKDRMRQRNAQPHDLVFANGNGKPDGQLWGAHVPHFYAGKTTTLAVIRAGEGMSPPAD